MDHSGPNFGPNFNFLRISWLWLAQLVWNCTCWSRIFNYYQCWSRLIKTVFGWYFDIEWCDIFGISDSDFYQWYFISIGGMWDGKLCFSRISAKFVPTLGFLFICWHWIVDLFQWFSAVFFTSNSWNRFQISTWLSWCFYSAIFFIPIRWSIRSLNSYSLIFTTLLIPEFHLFLIPLTENVTIFGPTDFGGRPFGLSDRLIYYSVHAFGVSP